MKNLWIGLLLLSSVCYAGTGTTYFGTSGGTVVFSSGTSAAISFTKGFNFRATSGFVTDGANTTYVTSADIYPTTRNGVTFGWTLDPNTLGGGDRDRNAGIDPRIAGMTFVGNNNTSSDTFKVDLPAAGSYAINLGMGDAGSNAKTNYTIVYDNTTPVITLFPASTLSTPTFADATGATYNAATWPGSQASVVKTFSTTSLFVSIGAPGLSAGTDSSITHLFITKQ